MGRTASVVFVFCVGIFVAFVAAQVPTDSFEGRAIEAVQIEGLDLIDEGYVRGQIRTRASENYSATRVAEDVSRLLRTGRFLDARAMPRLEDDRLIVTFTLREKPVVQSIEIVGNVKYSTKDLLKEVEFVVGDPVDRFLVSQSREQIERKYRDGGYAYAEVTVDEAALSESQRVIFQITEGPRVRVRKIEYEGNITYETKRLNKLVSTRTYIPIFRTGEFDPEQAERDAANIQTFHREHGFLEA
ncbi:MAG: hypothetical protein JXA69_03330, partial [Phycisphaerae bacterium]|nr:hypothetical protein [Phycisphaerae bacterium]